MVSEFMFAWLNFFILCFWFLFFTFLMSSWNFFSMLFNAELLWLCLYVTSGVMSSQVDDGFLLSMSFIILAVAAVELACGIMLIAYAKNTNLSINLSDYRGQKSRNKQSLNSFYTDYRRRFF